MILLQKVYRIAHIDSIDYIYNVLEEPVQASHIQTGVRIFLRAERSPIT